MLGARSQPARSRHDFISIHPKHNLQKSAPTRWHSHHEGGAPGSSRDRHVSSPVDGLFEGISGGTSDGERWVAIDGGSL